MVFVPYIGEKYAVQYMIPNYVGEGLAAFVPGLLSLIQNAGPSSDFSNITNATSGDIEPFQDVESRLLFSVSTYMNLLGVLLCVCSLAFAVLIHGRRGKNERYKFETEKRENLERSAEIAVLTEGNTEELKANPSQDEVFTTFYSQNVENGLLSSIVFFIVFLVYGFLPSIQPYAVSLNLLPPFFPAKKPEPSLFLQDLTVRNRRARLLLKHK